MTSRRAIETVTKICANDMTFNGVSWQGLPGIPGRADYERAYDQVDRLVAEKALKARQAGAHRKYIAGRVRGAKVVL